ncbi:MAG: hypothetical protein VR67_07910 [Peptococcaceae bacterium BRH_c8a]|nr:MAG: hypothetical protein VR67_07910 [Peptococcaceae bacterium BRH_c8a]
MTRLTDLEDDVYRCMRCGACQRVCPTFISSGLEPALARGRVRLIRELMAGKLSMSTKLNDYINACLGCRSCTDNCPSQVPTYKIVLAYKEAYASVKGLPLVYRVALQHVLKYPANLARIMHGLGVSRQLGVNNWLPKGLKAKENIIPPLPEKTFKEQWPAMQKSSQYKKVGLFLSCLDDLLFPRVPHAVIKLLNHFGYEVIIPEKLVCCGGPHIAYGDVETARKLAWQNIMAFADQDVDLIVTDCATCGSTWQSYPALFAGEPGQHQAQALASKVVDINRFIVQNINWQTGLKNVPQVITYHQPCHLSRYQLVNDEPLALLQAVAGDGYKEMADYDSCCGGAGTFNFTHYDLSMRILNRKINSIVSTGASIVATSCPACRIQLLHGIKKRHLKVSVRHPVELLAQAHGIINY